MVTILTIALVAVIVGCATWLFIDERRTAAADRLERQLKAARYRSEDRP